MAQVSNLCHHRLKICATQRQSYQLFLHGALAGGAAPGNLAQQTQGSGGAKEFQDGAGPNAHSFRPFGADS